jgi:hypothetical protein
MERTADIPLLKIAFRIGVDTPAPSLMIAVPLEPGGRDRRKPGVGWQ